jgi:hypothetical protein
VGHWLLEGKRRHEAARFLGHGGCAGWGNTWWPAVAAVFLGFGVGGRERREVGCWAGAVKNEEKCDRLLRKFWAESRLKRRERERESLGCINLKFKSKSFLNSNKIFKPFELKLKRD